MTKLKRALVCSVGGVAASVTLFMAITALQIEWLGRLYMQLALPVIELFFWLVPASLLYWLAPEGGFSGTMAVASITAIFEWAVIFAILAYLFARRGVLPNPAFEEGRRKSAAPLN